MGQTQAQRYALFSTPPNICIIFSSLFFAAQAKTAAQSGLLASSPGGSGVLRPVLDEIHGRNHQQRQRFGSREGKPQAGNAQQLRQ